MKQLLLIIALIPPATLFAAAPEKAGTIETDVVYGHKDGLAMTMDIYYPDQEPNGAAIVFVVSGGWVSRWAPPEQARPLLQPYLGRGYVMMAVRHGSSPRYGIPDASADMTRSIRFIRQNAERFEIDPERLGVMGMSAGGHLALLLGTTGDDGVSNAGGELDRVSSRVAAVVAFVPPTDLRVAVWEAPESLPAYRAFPALSLPLKDAGKYSPLVHVTSDDAPSLVIMGGNDQLVPPRHGEWIDKAFEKEKVVHKLIVVEGAGHGLEGDENRAMVFREAGDWFDKHLAAE